MGEQKIAAAGGSTQADDEARTIEDNLIAPCCWSQSVSHHQSAAAEEIRKGVREMLAAGKSREEILDHFVSIYGERILATPRARGFNVLVYILPWVALILGAWLLAAVVRKLRAPRLDAPQEGTPLPQARYAAVVEKELRDLEEFHRTNPIEK
jgi:cytochrome c-type biogenesis protein CcmH